jgi:hypothetical protein
MRGVRDFNVAGAESKEAGPRRALPVVRPGAYLPFTAIAVVGVRAAEPLDVRRLGKGVDCICFPGRRKYD